MSDSNDPYLSYANESLLCDDDGNLRVKGQRIPIQWILRTENYKQEGGDELHFTGLAYDRGGAFYGVTSVGEGSQHYSAKIEKLTGKQALTWFARHFSYSAAFTRELCRAIDNPEFEFRDIVPTRALPKRSRKARKKAEAFHEQLHLATALVECVRKLDADPTIKNLADACRSASAVHQAIHAPENFKLAANS